MGITKKKRGGEYIVSGYFLKSNNMKFFNVFISNFLKIRIGNFILPKIVSINIKNSKFFEIYQLSSFYLQFYI